LIEIVVVEGQGNKAILIVLLGYDEINYAE
jgi:hypothetical protein